MKDRVNMTEQFGGLPMESLIGGPLQAACKAEVMLAEAAGFEPGEENSCEKGATNTVPDSCQQTVTPDAPVLGIPKIPSLMVDQVDVTFDMKVEKSQATEQTDDRSLDPGEAWGPQPGAGYPGHRDAAQRRDR